MHLEKGKRGKFIGNKASTGKRGTQWSVWLTDLTVCSTNAPMYGWIHAKTGDAKYPMIPIPSASINPVQTPWLPNLTGREMMTNKRPCLEFASCSSTPLFLEVLDTELVVRRHYKYAHL